jgi:hypothetical protein
MKNHDPSEVRMEEKLKRGRNIEYPHKNDEEN